MKRKYLIAIFTLFLSGCANSISLLDDNIFYTYYTDKPQPSLNLRDTIILISRDPLNEKTMEITWTNLEYSKKTKMLKGEGFVSDHFSKEPCALTNLIYAMKISDKEDSTSYERNVFILNSIQTNSLGYFRFTFILTENCSVFFIRDGYHTMECAFTKLKRLKAG